MTDDIVRLCIEVAHAPGTGAAVLLVVMALELDIDTERVYILFYTTY